jgi:transposase
VTDVADSAWICQLVEHGLVRPSFVPPRPIRELRELTRYRKALLAERTREVQRLHKVLEDAGIKLASVASDPLGVSGRAMLEALVQGTNDPQVLAELARVAAPCSPLLALLMTIPGVSRRTAEVLLAEIGADMGPVPHRRAPGLLGGSVPGQPRVGGQAWLGSDPQGLQVATSRLGRGGARGRADQGQLPGRPVRPAAGSSGSQEGPLAVAHSILVIAWHLLSRGEPYTDLGADYFWCGAKQVAIPSPLAALVWAHHNPLGAPPGC